jgi:hypothetical protein
LDAEKAIAVAKRKAKTAEDKHAGVMLGKWLSGLEDQRQFMPRDGIEMAKKSTCVPNSNPK